MAEKTSIEWTRGDDGTPGATWNPLVGCTKVSPGCDHCYAETLVNRFAGHNKAFPNTFDVVTIRDDRMLTQPLRWARPRRIFVNSLSDLFHADVPDEFIAQVFAVMALAPDHTFQLLTKRHARMRSLLSSAEFEQRVWWKAGLLSLVRNSRGVLAPRPRLNSSQIGTWPLPNVWLGVSVEDQHWADIRVPALLGTPAAVRWISAEPLLGPVRLGLIDTVDGCTCSGSYYGTHEPGCGSEPGPAWGIGWVVVGGESGGDARPMLPEWASGLRRECAEAGVPFLFKQWGNWAPDPDAPPVMVFDTEGHGWSSRMRYMAKKVAGRELDGRTWDEYP